MKISIETPVFKGDRLQRCIDSVLHQSSSDWEYSLLWDGGDDASLGILEALDRRKLPNVTVHFGDNRGIARARRFLTEHSQADYILPLDDDDALPFNAVERFLAIAKERPWASVIRGQREIIDDEGKVLDTPPWFPFERRHYERGMVTDLMNHTQPYLISRWAYGRTSGWEGFKDFFFAGEDCDIYVKLEEVGTIELVDEPLYYYRIHDKRQSLVLTNEAAFEMWRRIADKTIARIGLYLKRVGDRPPYRYEPLTRPEAKLENVDFVVTGGDGARTVRALERAGAREGSVHRVNPSSVVRLDEAWRSTTRPLVCIVDDSVEIDESGALANLLAAMQARGSDLASPRLVSDQGTVEWSNPGFGRDKRPIAVTEGAGLQGGTTSARWLDERLLVARREVLKAVGGFDAGFGEPHMAVVDFSLRARQRSFACDGVGDVAFTTARREPSGDDSPALERLRRKWQAYPDLFV